MVRSLPGPLPEQKENMLVVVPGSQQPDDTGMEILPEALAAPDPQAQFGVAKTTGGPDVHKSW